MDPWGPQELCFYCRMRGGGGTGSEVGSRQQYHRKTRLRKLGEALRTELHITLIQLVEREYITPAEGEALEEFTRSASDPSTPNVVSEPFTTAFARACRERALSQLKHEDQHRGNASVIL